MLNFMSLENGFQVHSRLRSPSCKMICFMVPLSVQYFLKMQFTTHSRNIRKCEEREKALTFIVSFIIVRFLMPKKFISDKLFKNLAWHLPEPNGLLMTKEDRLFLHDKCLFLKPASESLIGDV